MPCKRKIGKGQTLRLSVINLLIANQCIFFSSTIDTKVSNNYAQTTNVSFCVKIDLSVKSVAYKRLLTQQRRTKNTFVEYRGADYLHSVQINHFWYNSEEWRTPLSSIEKRDRK